MVGHHLTMLTPPELHLDKYHHASLAKSRFV